MEQDGQLCDNGVAAITDLTRLQHFIPNKASSCMQQKRMISNANPISSSSTKDSFFFQQTLGLSQTTEGRRVCSVPVTIESEASLVW